MNLWKQTRQVKTRLSRRNLLFRKATAIFLSFVMILSVAGNVSLFAVSAAEEEQTLNCQYETHQHSENCYSAEGELVCGLSDYVAHTHDENCYDAEGALICDFLQTEEHTPTEACMQTVPTEETIQRSYNANTESNEETAKEIVIYHTNDTHGYLDGSTNHITIGQVAALKKSTSNSILVDAGDATQGLPLASLTKGADVIDLMNLAGYDLMAAGNHEFDFGTEQLLSNAARANFPILAANVYRNGQRLLAGTPNGNNGCHTVIECSGVKIGFFGLTTAGTATSTNPAGISDLEFTDEVTAAKQEINGLEDEGADIIIAVCHMGNTDAPCTSVNLANAMTDNYQNKIDVIIDAHSHTVENEGTNGILIVQTGAYLAGVGKLTLTVNGEEVQATEELLDAKALANVSSDPEVTEKLAEIQASQTGLLNEKLGDAETTLWGGSIGSGSVGVAIARLVETNFGDLVADAFCDAAQTFMQTVDEEDAALPIIAAENGGGIRGGVTNGDITVGELITAFPYSNTLYLKKVTPKILYEAMEVSGTKLAGQNLETGMLLQESNSGGFLQISGFTVVFDPDGEEGHRVTSITLDGETEPLDRDDGTREILMVGNNYIMSGGGGSYSMLGALQKYGEAGGELETIHSYIEKCIAGGTLQQYTGTQNRIQMRSSGYVPKDYTASILITDEAGNLLPNQALSYRVDGGTRQNGTTDENGILKVILSDGSHGVRLADDQQEVYLDNYSGFGIYEDQYRTQVTLTFLADGSCDPIPDDTQGQGGAEDGGDVKEPSSYTPSDSSSGHGTTISPGTGDDTNITLWIFIMLTTATALTTAIVSRRRRKRSGLLTRIH